MKYVVRLKLDKNEISSDYRRIFISFFKRAISKYMDGVFYNELYEDGGKYKSLVWSVRFNGPSFKEDNIQLNNNEIEMTLKFSDVHTALIYYSSLLEMKGKSFPLNNDNNMILKDIFMVKEPEINGDFAVFKVLSPICLKQHQMHEKDRFVSIGDDDFLMELQKKLIEDIPDKSEKIKSLKYNMDELKKIIVRAYGLKIPVSIGNFAVNGDNEILNHILKNGIGSKRNSGFGLVEQKV